MAFHFGVPGARAGFLGVDLFFVLSGFLITRILLSQLEHRRVNLVDFWTRRVRRLAPALVVAIAAVIAWAALTAPVTLRDGLRADITATLAYVANWHLHQIEQLLCLDRDASPLQHMWTLAVEEHFYIVWPLMLWFVSRLIATPRVRIIAVGSPSQHLASSVGMETRVTLDSAGADRAYMGTDSRIFGPLVGALLAVVLVRAPPTRRRSRLARGASRGRERWCPLGVAPARFGERATQRYSTGGALIFASLRQQ